MIASTDPLVNGAAVKDDCLAEMVLRINIGGEEKRVTGR